MIQYLYYKLGGKILARKRAHPVELTVEEVELLKQTIRKKKTPWTIERRCRILLELDDVRGNGRTHKQIAEMLGVSPSTVNEVNKKYLAGGVEEVLTIHRHENSNNSGRKVDGRAEAQLVAMSLSEPPEGYARWTLRLLEEKSKVVLETPVGKDAIRRTLKKTNLSRTR